MQLADLTWPAVEGLSKAIPVVIPVAALEQHGRHLPLFTDSLALGEIVRRAEARLGQRVLFAPLLWLGNSEHHLDFPGTLSAPPRAYLDLLCGLMENFLGHGFRRLVFLNGHGGNDVPGRQALFEVRQRHRHRQDLLLLWATYWQLGEGTRAPDEGFAQSQMAHADEWETSMMLRLVPGLVSDPKSLATIDSGRAFEPAHRAWITRERTQSGHLGSPQWASAEKGERLFQRFTEEVVSLLERVVRWDGQSWNG